VYRENIDKILIVKSNYKDIVFYQQNAIPELLNQKWLYLKKSNT